MSDPDAPRRCRICILPEGFPGAGLDEEGICRFCREQNRTRPSLDDLANKLATAIESRNKTSDYDSVVAFSGGKDSTYTLWKLTEEMGLRCLPIMIDNGFLSETAIANGRRISEKLGCELQTVRPDPIFLRELFQVSNQSGLHSAAALRRASGICNSCIGIINDTVIREAVRNGVDLIAGGYLAGQIPTGAVTMQVNVESHLRFEAIKRERWKSFISEEALEVMPPSWSMDDKHKNVTIINPMLAWNPTEDQIFDCITKLGWEPPSDTGLASSNCRLNDVGIARHIAQHGFHPYMFEWAEQVRLGLMDRDEAIRRVENAPRPLSLPQEE